VVQTKKYENDLCKANDAPAGKNKCIRPIYFEVRVMVLYHMVPYLMSLLLLGHAFHLCVDFRCNWRFLSNHVESQGATHIGIYLTCYCEKGESNDKGFITFGAALLHEKHKFQNIQEKDLMLPGDLHTKILDQLNSA